jgi:hypothetical protein
VAEPQAEWVHSMILLPRSWPSKSLVDAFEEAYICTSQRLNSVPITLRIRLLNYEGKEDRDNEKLQSDGRVERIDPDM